jgi:L,D-peptidoglycan transpeptidase YkuD (ErfK/YbiS/YcfS/YnhG family)
MKKLPQLLAALAVVALVAAGIILTQRADAATVPAYDPTRLAHVGDAGQLIVVTGNSKTSSYGTLRTYQKTADGTWSAKFAAMAARNGYGGWVAASSRVQNTGTTPKGTFAVTDAFGLKANPGTRMKYRLLNSNDYWVGDSRDAKTYNLFQTSAPASRTWRKSQSEHLADYPTQYEYAAVIDFNRPAASSLVYDTVRYQWYTTKPVNTTRGSAIFLHVNGAGSTAGCVSLRRTDLISVLKWLDPAKKPRIVMAPEASIGKA